MRSAFYIFSNFSAMNHFREAITLHTWTGPLRFQEVEAPRIFKQLAY